MKLNTLNPSIKANPISFLTPVCSTMMAIHLLPKALLSIPTVTIPDPKPLLFPCALVYKLNRKLDWQYCWGYIYSTLIMLIEFSRREEAELLYNIATPAGVYLLQFDTSSKSYIMGTVEGMIEMPPGVPFVVNIDGDESHSITVACLQTLDSLQGYSKYPTNTLRLKSLFLFQLRIYGFNPYVAFMEFTRRPGWGSYIWGQ